MFLNADLQLILLMLYRIQKKTWKILKLYVFLRMQCSHLRPFSTVFDILFPPNTITDFIIAYLNMTFIKKIIFAFIHLNEI